jgi:Rieske Fe-S protein
MSTNPRDGDQEQPAAPGERHDQERRDLIAWLWRLPVLAALGGGAYGVYRGWQVHFVKPPASEPTFTAAEPLAISRIDAFPELWSSVAFTFEDVPSVALRIPESVPGSVPFSGTAGDTGHLAAFSRICTHQGCIVNLNRSTEAIAVATNYRGEQPALVCNCHLSVFDPLAAGRAVAGPAQLPLARVELDMRDDEVYAIGIEPS